MKKLRITCFVCSGIKNNNLITKNIDANTELDASNIFEANFGVKPQSIYGPFFKKRSYAINNVRDIKFSGNTISAIYNGWRVKAIILSHPENYALILFNDRIDGKKISKPKGTHIIKIGELNRQ